MNILVEGEIEAFHEPVVRMFVEKVFTLIGNTIPLTDLLMCVRLSTNIQIKFIGE